VALYRISFSIPIGVVPLTVNDIQGIRSNWLRKIRYGYRRTRQLRIAFRGRDGPSNESSLDEGDYSPLVRRRPTQTVGHSPHPRHPPMSLGPDQTAGLSFAFSSDPLTGSSCCLDPIFRLSDPRISPSTNSILSRRLLMFREYFCSAFSTTECNWRVSVREYRGITVRMPIIVPA
jgi:hypothetical protein